MVLLRLVVPALKPCFTIAGEAPDRISQAFWIGRFKPAQNEAFRRPSGVTRDLGSAAGVDDQQGYDTSVVPR